MKKKSLMILGALLVLAFSASLAMAANQQTYGAAGQGYTSGYYDSNGSGYAYCPMGPGYGYSAPATQDYRQYTSRSWNRGYRGAWCPWNSGYNRNYRAGWGCW